MPLPTDAEPFAGANPLARLWAKPIKDILPTLEATKDKPVGQFTMGELLSWAAVVGYVIGSMVVAETLALNVLRVAVRGR